jgi:hypothetical protein
VKKRTPKLFLAIRAVEYIVDIFKLLKDIDIIAGLFELVVRYISILGEGGLNICAEYELALFAPITLEYVIELYVVVIVGFPSKRNLGYLVSRNLLFSV